ncbi:MAG: rhomboid family intramembrane serine protease [Planctomycetaceae bacterium]|nr:rhomboid family intramembrane serine protease [Planctomycetaceae bacterium]
MFVPINTDAPLYHFPYATIGLIVANVVCFVVTGFVMDADFQSYWLLEYGNGINPFEWFTAAFAHSGWGHLIGNMFFLWGFGLVVEGKLGWARFLKLYFFLILCWGGMVDVLTLHRTQGFILSELGCQDRDEFQRKLVAGDEDLSMRVNQQGLYIPLHEIKEEELSPEEYQALGTAILEGLQGRCLGASGVIFGLLAISLVWAPKNEMHVVGFLFLRVFSFDITIMSYALWYLGLNILTWVLAPSMGTSGLHLVGAVAGLAVGIYMLKKNRVDCENWDLFSVLSGKYGRFAEEDWVLGAHSRTEKEYSELPVPEATEDERDRRQTKGRQKKLQPINELIDSGDVLTAAEELLNLRMEDSSLCPNEERTQRLALGLVQAEAWDYAEIWLQEFIDRYPAENRWAKIRMAQLQLRNSRPRAAIQNLKGMSLEGLNPALAKIAKQTAGKAKEMVQQGIEDAEQDW